MNDLPLPEWLLRWFGVDVDALEGGSASVRFVRFPENEMGLLAILAFVVVAAFVGWIYSREGAVTAIRKVAMVSVRALLIALIAVVVFYPVLEVRRARDLRATTLVLLDDSLSMDIKDRYLGAVESRQAIATLLGIDESAVSGKTRADIVNHVLAHEDRAMLEALRASNLIKVATFSDQLRPIGTVEPESGDDRSGAGGGTPPGAASSTGTSTTASGAAPNPPLPDVRLEPRGPRTDLAGAIRQAIEQQGGGRIAALIVVSDFRLTAGEGLSGVAELLAQKKIPVHAIGVGDPTPPRNYRISTILASERVFAGDPINVEVRVQQKGYDDEPVTVELLDQPPGEALEKSLGSFDVVFSGGQSEGSAHFSVELDGLGKHRLTARIEPRTEEFLADDNTREMSVEVVEEASKVLLIAGAPTWEYRFLKNLLRRDRRVFVAAWLMSADPDYPQEGNVSLDKLPLETKELFEYDVVMLLDADPRELPPGYGELLEKFVGKHRGGLVYVAGEKYTPRFFQSQSTEVLVGMLPVIADITRIRSSGGSETPWPIVPTRAAASHAATKLSSLPDRNAMRWSELEGAYWSFPVKRAKPGATVLLTHADPRRAVAGERNIVMAWQYYEGGRVMFVGIDETWRWRSTTTDIYDQFWMQLVRYLTETRLIGGSRELIQTESEAYELGDVVRVSALLLDEGYQPIEIESQPVSVEDPQGEASEITLDRDDSAPGWYRGVFVPRRLGEHRLRLPQGAETAVLIEAPDLEYQEPRLDEAVMREVAERTGGRAWPIQEAARVPAEIPDRRQTVVSTDDPIPLWDTWVSMSLFAGLLTLEWILRKWNRLL